MNKHPATKIDSLVGSLSHFSIGKPINLKKIRKKTMDEVAREVVRESANWSEGSLVKKENPNFDQDFDKFGKREKIEEVVK